MWSGKRLTKNKQQRGLIHERKSSSTEGKAAIGYQKTEARGINFIYSDDEDFGQTTKQRKEQVGTSNGSRYAL